VLGEIGTLAWTRRTNGLLSRPERLLTQQARAIPRCRTAAALGAGFGLALKLGPWQD
jgi:hypothetical protein